MGGIKLNEPSVDLAIALSLASANKNLPIDKTITAFGEVGLTGEIRPVSQAEKRVLDSIKFGFKKVIIPKRNYDSVKKHSQKSISDFVNVSYQCEEDGYYPRSFEDAFINVNLATLKKHQDQLLGLKNKDEIDTNGNIYDLTQKIIDKKSDFASSLLYVAYTDKSVEWTTPKYIWEGLEWLQTR